MQQCLAPSRVEYRPWVEAVQELAKRAVGDTYGGFQIYQVSETEYKRVLQTVYGIYS